MSAAGSSDPGSISIQPSRSIGDIQADATISEVGDDETEITRHPVEQGAAITDHAFSEPSNLVIEAAWSNSSFAANGDDTYCANIYKNLLDMRAQRIPFDVLTPQRKYTNMLIKSLTKRTDEKTENALKVTIVCRQIIIVQTQTTPVPSADVQKMPQKTNPPANTGTVSTVLATNYNAGSP